EQKRVVRSRCLPSPSGFLDLPASAHHHPRVRFPSSSEQTLGSCAREVGYSLGPLAEGLATKGSNHSPA
ncbi:hypothetical protein P7K49_022613, partial [Saguinus oedipus]